MMNSLQIVSKRFTVTDFRRRISIIWNHVDVLGNVAIITRRGKDEVVFMSIETYAYLLPDPAAYLIEMQERRPAVQ